MTFDYEPQYVSIVGSAGSRLVLRHADEWAWELRRADHRIGRIALVEGRLTGAAGSWMIEWPGRRRRGPRIMLRPLPPGEWTAAFYPNRLFRGGSIALSHDRLYRARFNALTGTWRLLNGEGNELMRLAPSTEYRKERPRPFELALRETQDPEPAVLLAVLTACYVLVAFEPTAPIEYAGG